MSNEKSNEAVKEKSPIEQSIDNLQSVTRGHQTVYTEHQKYGLCIYSLRVAFGLSPAPGEKIDIPDVSTALNVLKNVCVTELRLNAETHDVIQNSINLLQSEITNISENK